jgi:hypothetical protein
LPTGEIMIERELSLINLLPLLANVPALDILCFALALWLGTYLLQRNIQNMRLRLTGIGLILYACAESCFALGSMTSTFHLQFSQAGRWLLPLSTLLWTGALIYALPEESLLHNSLVLCWRIALWPLIVLSGIAVLWWHPLIALMIPLLPLPVVLALAYHTQTTKQKLFTGVSLLLFLTTALSLTWLPDTYARLLICGALLVLGIALAALEAKDQGEALLPDLLRSFDYAMLTALAFGGQVAVVMLLGIGVTFPSFLLLQSAIATAIISQVFSRVFVKLFDSIAFATFPQLMKERQELHTAIDILPRLQPEMDLEALEDAEFTRLTRRALSHLGDLSRLASNPLVHLPLIKTNLQERGVRDEDVLERAAELKALLVEHIQRLKPRDKGDFGTSDEWRYYNALFFPYVGGLKPYSTRPQHPPSDPVAREALNWFRVQIPERTLHNWQNTAARLIAQDLRAQNRAPTQKKPLPGVKTGRT